MKSKHLLPVALLASFASCRSAGPQSIEHERGQYNVALQRTNNEQLLLNVVRLRYRDTPVFVQVSNIASKVRRTRENDWSVTLENGMSSPWVIGGGNTWSEEPTVSYTPLQGDQFVRELLAPIDIATIVLLSHSGWSIERVARLCAQGINGVKNAPSASGPTPERTPEFGQFLRVATLFRELQVEDAFQLGFQEADSDDPFVELVFSVGPDDDVRVSELYTLLGLDLEASRFPLRVGTGDGASERLTLMPRSLMATLFYVSQGVDVPERDVSAGRVTVTRAPDGRPFDWRELTDGLMQIHSSLDAPRDAYVAVHYRDAWFYIEDSDLASKSTFSLLTQLFALQAGTATSSGPVLTLDV